MYSVLELLSRFGLVVGGIGYTVLPYCSQKKYVRSVDRLTFCMVLIMLYHQDFVILLKKGHAGICPEP